MSDKLLTHSEIMSLTMVTHEDLLIACPVDEVTEQNLVAVAALADPKFSSLLSTSTNLYKNIYETSIALEKLLTILEGQGLDALANSLTNLIASQKIVLDWAENGYRPLTGSKS